MTTTDNPRAWRCSRCGKCRAGYPSESAAIRADRHHAEQSHPTHTPTRIEVDR